MSQSPTMSSSIIQKNLVDLTWKAVARPIRMIQETVYSKDVHELKDGYRIKRNYLHISRVVYQ